MDDAKQRKVMQRRRFPTLYSPYTVEYKMPTRYYRSQLFRAFETFLFLFRENRILYFSTRTFVTAVRWTLYEAYNRYKQREKEI